jgi:hypothetical protein
MTFNVPVLLVVLFILKHLVCDFFLQSNYQASHKHVFLHPGGILHAAINGIGTAVVVAIAAPGVGIPIALWLGLADMFSHYAIDFMKMNVNEVFKLDTSQATYWRVLAIDQALHWIMYAVFMVYVASRALVYGPFVFLTVCFSVITVGATMYATSQHIRG